MSVTVFLPGKPSSGSPSDCSLALVERTKSPRALLLHCYLKHIARKKVLCETKALTSLSYIHLATFCCIIHMIDVLPSRMLSIDIILIEIFFCENDTHPVLKP
jgi:hypothetical protein